MSSAIVTDIRAGRHECFARLVVDLACYRGGHVDTVTMEGSDTAVPLRGGAFLQITARVPAYDSAGSTYRPSRPTQLVAVNGYQTLRQAALAGSFEPTGVVIDVAHY